jgi:glyoxylase I family protein
MKIEHVAFQVPEPVALADWYVDHLGLRVARSTEGPGWARFLADDTDAVMVEVYRNPNVAVPDYRAIDPLMLHLAFQTDDVSGTRERLMAAGATPVGDVVVSDVGDHLAMLRDPWGLAIQLVHRRDPMIR